MINTFLDDIHRPALPYKFKFKFSGCPNDCMNSIQRADMAIIVDGRFAIPEDVAIVGYDDIAYSATSIVPLTSVRQSPELIGSTALGLLHAEANNGSEAVKQIVIQPELVIRASSKR